MSIRESKSAAWAAMLLITAVLIVAICLGVIKAIWDYAAIFCAFMMAFCHLMAVWVKKISPDASRKLDVAAFWFGVLTIIGIIVIFII